MMTKLQNLYLPLFPFLPSTAAPKLRAPCSTTQTYHLSPLGSCGLAVDNVGPNPGQLFGKDTSVPAGKVSWSSNLLSSAMPGGLLTRASIPVAFSPAALIKSPQPV